MSYKSFEAIRKHVAIETLKEMSYEEIDDALQSLADKINDQQYKLAKAAKLLKNIRTASLSAIPIMPGGQEKADLRDAYDDVTEFLDQLKQEQNSENEK